MLRQYHKLSQEQLGERCGYHPTFISMVERINYKHTTVNKIIAICLAFLLISCGDDVIVHRSGESTVTKIVSIASADNIFVQGEDRSMSMIEFESHISSLVEKEQQYSFVIQSTQEPEDDVTKSIEVLLMKYGVPKRHIAVAKPDA